MTQVPASPPERPRPLRDERESNAGLPLPWEPGRLFAQVSAEEGDAEGFSHALASPLSPGDLALIRAFAEQLVPRLNAANQWPLQATLFLPRLGRVEVTARREQGAWYVELEAEQERSRVWLAGMRQQGEDRLSADLGQPVYLSLAAPACP